MLGTFNQIWLPMTSDDKFFIHVAICMYVRYIGLPMTSDDICSNTGTFNQIWLPMTRDDKSFIHVATMYVRCIQSNYSCQ